MAEWQPLTETDVSNTLERLRGKLGTYIGNWQCYAVVAWYVHELTDHPHMGAGITSDYDRIDVANGAAGSIPTNYRWTDYGYTVITDPSLYGNLKSGDIICYKPNSRASYGRVFSSGKFGHTAVVYGVSDRGYTVLEQLGSKNHGKGSVLYMNTINESVELHANAVSGIVRPPTDKGGGKNLTSIATRLIGAVNKGFSNISGNIFGQTIVSTPSGFASMPINTMLEISRLKFDTQNFNVGEIIKSIEEVYKEDIPNRVIESQMFSGEFCGYSIFNLFNAYFSFKPELIKQGEDNTLLVSGCVGDSNHVQITIKDYNQQDRIASLLTGFVDSGSKSLTILSDNVDTFMQANNNKYDAMMRNFKENTFVMEKQNEVANKNLNLNSEKMLYEANYALTSSRIDFGIRGITTAGMIGLGIVNPLAFVEGGGVGGVIGGIPNLINSYRQMGYSEEQLGFTERQVGINKQSTALANMARKLGITQSMRMYLANISDIENMPDTVLQLGDDLSFQNGNTAGDIYTCLEMPLQYYSNIINDYFTTYGIKLGLYEKDLRDRTKKRKLFNYIQTSSVRIESVDANQTFINTLKSIFNSGVRIWNHSNFENESDFYVKYRDLYIENDDLWEEDGEIGMTKSEFINSLTAEDCATIVSKMDDETCAVLINKARTYLRINQTPSPWHEEEWQKGIDYGVTDGLDPHDLTTREMAVSLVVRSIEQITYDPDNVPTP